MADSVLIERVSTPDGEVDVRATAVSDVPIEEEVRGDVPAIGTVLDARYEITGLLGQGGMGHVLSARHVILGQRLAIKILRREMTRDTEIVERFRREARAASAIGHLGIVAVKDFGTLPTGASYYVMEHVEGVSLGEALNQERQFTIERAVDVVRQVADALGAAHAAGIVHRDVKPENVLLSTFHGRPDHVKILDFGIAKLDFASRLSGAHRVLGTPAYMSPEQAKGQTLDQRTDVYALGILFYELLAGEVPFDDRRPLEVLRLQIQTPAPSIRLVRPDVPEVLEKAIAACLEKSPDARPTNMAALIAVLDSFAPPRGAGFALSSPSSPTIVAPLSVPSPARASTSAAYAATRLSIASVPTPTPAPARALSRPTPIATAAPAKIAPKRRVSTLTLALGIALTVFGVAALAAAGGVLIRERSDDALVPVASAPIAPVVLPATSIAPVVPPPAVLAPPPVTTTPAIAAPPPSLGHVMPHHASHPSEVAAPVTEVAPPPVAAPHDEHPTIRVIDPWDHP